MRLSQGRAAYILAIVWLAFGVTLVYLSPRSLIAFLIFISSALLIYYLKLSNRAKLSLAILIALVLLPIVGVRNIFYLEVIFQISVFAALALGLNIVVGFAGLLDLGYVAFYAVGAYLWAFFGSQQPYPAARRARHGAPRRAFRAAGRHVLPVRHPGAGAGAR